MFADDVTAFVRNRKSLEALLCTTDLFIKCFGLEINYEKTECMLLGNQVSLAAMDVISSKNIQVKVYCFVLVITNTTIVGYIKCCLMCYYLQIFQLREIFKGHMWQFSDVVIA